MNEHGQDLGVVLAWVGLIGLALFLGYLVMHALGWIV